MRGGDVVKVHSLRRGSAEAIEAVAHGTNETSLVVGKKIEDINLPHGCNIVTIVREQEVIMAHHDTIIEQDDHVILFLTDRRNIIHLEKLFAKDLT